MTGVTSEFECPVCHEDYTEPKILPCAHLACRNCVISWLGTGGGQGGCPMCRSTILPPNRPGEGNLATLVDALPTDLATRVDALPTDLATVALVESHKILSSPHVCTMCQTNVIATSYCLQCDVKLCQACTSYHQKLPGTKDHSFEDLSKLTALNLATSRRSTCKSHANKTAEFFCSSHEDAICILCAATNHRSCPEVKAISDVAKGKRTELTQQAERLRQKETALAEHIKTVKDKFKAMRRKVKDVFDDLQQCVEMRRQQVNDLIQAVEDKVVTSLTDLEKVRAVVTSHVGTIDHIVTSSPDDDLMLMSKQLMSRLNDLELQSGKTDKVKTVGDLSFDDQILTRLKSDLSALGKISHPIRTLTTSQTTYNSTTAPSTVGESQTTVKPRGAALAGVLKVGDRVRRGPDWNLFRTEDGDGPGTVRAIPSRIMITRGRDPQGWVDVRWDNGTVHCYRMGLNNKYELDLV